MDDPYVAIADEYTELSVEFEATKELREKHTKLAMEYYNLQQKCKAEMTRHKRRITNLRKDLSRIPKATHDDDIKKLDKMMKAQIHEIQEVETRLPGNNGIYLRLIVGDLNLTLPTSDLKRRYKENYEKWKLGVSSAIFIFSVLNLIVSHRLSDALHYFLILWFYCTLTVRESILTVNGSRIRGWWVSHHYISAFLTGIHILWPADAHGYTYFRTKFVILSLLLSLVQVLQYTYQSGLLYRLRSLGKVDLLHITIDGLPKWMLNSKDSIAFYVVTPFLLFIYAFQFYLSIILFQLWLSLELTEGPSNTWQIIGMSALYLLLAVGNCTTLVMTLRSKKKKEEVTDKSS